MYEQDSDILTVTEEDEQLETEVFEQPEQENDTLFENVNQTSNTQNTLFEEVEPSPSQPAVSPVQEKAVADFVKTSYSTNNLRKVYKKYNVVQTYVPRKKALPKTEKKFETFVKQQDSYVPERETVVVEKVKAKPTYKLNQKAKAWLFGIVSIFVMLGGLAVYNAVHISNLNRQIAQTQYDITEVNKSIEKATKTLEKLSDKDEVLQSAHDDYGMHQASETEQITIELNQKNEVIDYQGESNFFDKICQFFAHLFGG